MKTIYDSIKKIQTSVSYSRPNVDDNYDDFDDYYGFDDDYIEDEGTGPPIKAVPFVNPYTKPEVNPSPHTKLLSGYTSENWEINVNNKYINITNSLLKKKADFFFYY